MGGAFFFFLHCSSHQKKVPTRSEASKEFLKSIFASSGRRRIRRNPNRGRGAARRLWAPWRARRRRCRSRCCRRRWRAPTAPAPSPTGSPPTTRARPRPSRSSGSTSSSIPSRPSSKAPALVPIRSGSPVPFQLSRRLGLGLTTVPSMALAGSARRTTPPCPTRRPRRRSSRRGVCAAFDFPLSLWALDH